MKNLIFLTALIGFVFFTQISCTNKNSSQPNGPVKDSSTVNVSTANAVQIEDLNRLISKLTYYRSPRNLQDAKPQSIEEIKATFGKQEPDVDPVIEGIYKELSDKYKNDSEFLLALNGQFLKYLFMIEDEKRFTALVNQMPEIRMSEIVYKKDDLLNMLKKIKNIDSSIQSSIGNFEKLIKLYVPSNSPIFGNYVDPYHALSADPFTMDNLFAVQSQLFCQESAQAIQFDTRADQLALLLLDTLKEDTSELRLEEALKRISALSISIPAGNEFSGEDYKQMAKAIIDTKYHKVKALKSDIGLGSLNITPSPENVFKISDHFYLIRLGQVHTEGYVQGYLVIKKIKNGFVPIFYIEERSPIC